MGLATAPEFARDVYHQETLGWMLQRTKHIGDDVLYPANLGEIEPVTDIGRKALGLMLKEETSGNFGFPRRLVGCTETEINLLANIRHEVRIASQRSPVIITRGDRPIGIIQGYTDACYGLESDLESGLIAGCLSEPPDKEIRQRSSGQSTRAWSIALEEVGRFIPMRFAAFEVPVQERACLLPTAKTEADIELLTTSHDQITARTEELLEDAVPLPVAA